MLLSQRSFVWVNVSVRCLQVCLARKTTSCQTDKGHRLKQVQFSQGVPVWRMVEHKKTTASATNEHCQNTGYQLDWKNVRIIKKEDQWMEWKITEAIEIRCKKSLLYRDHKCRLPLIFCNLLSHAWLLAVMWQAVINTNNWACSDSWWSPREKGESFGESTTT